MHLTCKLILPKGPSHPWVHPTRGSIRLPEYQDSSHRIHPIRGFSYTRWPISQVVHPTRDPSHPWIHPIRESIMSVVPSYQLARSYPLVYPTRWPIPQVIPQVDTGFEFKIFNSEWFYCRTDTKFISYKILKSCEFWWKFIFSYRC